MREALYCSAQKQRVRKEPDISAMIIPLPTRTLRRHCDLFRMYAEPHLETLCIFLCLKLSVQGADVEATIESHFQANSTLHLELGLRTVCKEITGNEILS